MIRLKDLLKEVLTESDDISIINEYIKWSKYDIVGSWGSCAGYTQDFLNFCKDTGKSCKALYLPFAKPDGNVDADWDGTEDHIVPLLNGKTIIDFAYVPGKGVSKHDRTGNPPKLSPGTWPTIVTKSDALFEKNGLYGKLGYVKGSKYAPWVIKDIPELNKGIYPIVMNTLPSWAEPEFPKAKINEMSANAKNYAPQGVLFLNSNKILVGDNHHDPVELSEDLFDTILKVGRNKGYYGEGKGIGHNPGVMASQIYKALKDSGAQHKGSWDDKVKIPEDEKYVYLATIFSNPTENKRVPRLLSKVKENDTIFNLLTREMNNHTQPGLALKSDDLKKFLEEISEKGIDFIKLSQQPATEKNLQNFVDKGEKLTWPSNWEKYPNKAGQMARRETILRDTWLIEEAPPGVYFIGSGHLKDISKMSGKKIIGGEKIGSGSTVAQK